MNLGRRGERAAAKFLRRLGYRILTRNYECPAGEIDLIAGDGDTLVFVEVKTRQSSAAADPEIAVNYFKQQQVSRAAKYFLAHMRVQNLPCRFDVVSVVIPVRGPMQIEHFVNAF